MQDPVSNPSSKYTLKMKKDSKDYDEQVEVDTEKLKKQRLSTCQRLHPMMKQEISSTTLRRL